MRNDPFIHWVFEAILRGGNCMNISQPPHPVIHSGLIEVFGNFHLVMSRAGGSKSRWLVTFINDAASKFITEI